MLQTIGMIAGIVTGVSGTLIAVLSHKASNDAIATFRSNCIATLNTKVDTIEKNIERLKDNQGKLFDKFSEFDRQGNSVRLNDIDKRITEISNETRSNTVKVMEIDGYMKYFKSVLENK